MVYLRVFMGVILILGGLCPLLLWFVFSTMILIDPDLPSSEWWAEWRERAFAGEPLAWLILGIVMIVTGSWLLNRASKRTG